MRPSCCRVPGLGAMLGATLFLSATAQQTPRPQVLIKAGRLIDPKAGTVLANQAILVEGDRVKETGPAATVAGHATAGARVIDLGAATVLPGLIDCHTHITSDPGDYYEQLFRRSPIDQAVVAHIYARRTLEAGFTTIRNVGADEFVDVALRNAIDRGDVAGPRMQVSTMPLSATGGHGDVNGFSPYLRFEQFSGIANGVDEIRSKVRWEIKYGADLIKVLASAGVLSEEESVGAPQYSQEELNALVAEAAMWGKKVAAHAHGAEAIKRAVRAGVVSIEHGSLLDDEGIRLMKEKGTYLVADVYNDDYIIAEYARLGYPQKTIDKERQVGRAQRENFQRAVRAGVKIAFGTDAGVYPHGWNAKQFAHMVRWGLTPMQAIQAATVNAADLMGWSDRVGSLEPGHYADVIAVHGDPLADVTTLEKMAFVMKGGAVVKEDRP
jgi:imidazolonepropionase-like amidohydrolase